MLNIGGCFEQICHKKNYIRIFQRNVDKIHHVFLELVLRFEHTWSIREYDLIVRSVGQSDYSMSGSLSFGSNDGDSFPHQNIHEGRFAHIGFPDDIDESSLMRFLRHFTKFFTKVLDF